MAALARSVIKMTVVVGTIPMVAVAVGYRLRLDQAEANSFGVKRVCRVCDLPMYNQTDNSELKDDDNAPYPCNVVEEGVSLVRKTVQEVLGEFVVACSTVKATAMSSLDSSRANLKQMHSNSGELPRVVLIIAGAGIGGILLGQKGSTLKKLTYGSLSAASCAVFCYPREIMKINHSVVKFVRELWEETVGDGAKSLSFKEGEMPAVNEMAAQRTSDSYLAESSVLALQHEEGNHENLEIQDLLPKQSPRMNKL